MINVFYSWQSDLENTSNRSFIEDCIKKAIKTIHKSEEYYVEYNLERDTQNTSGTLDIVETIFTKIRNSHIFICDISIINFDSQDKKCPNPNVLLELGYAASILGWENVICIYNTAFGGIESLPFDLKFRRPLVYKLGAASDKNKSIIKEDLTKAIETALLAADPQVAIQRKSILKEFSNETAHAIHIALNKPKYWAIKLAEELLRSKLAVVNEKYTQLDKNLVYRRIISYDGIEFIGKMVNAMEDMGNLINFFLSVTNDVMKEAQKTGNPIDIKLSIDKLIDGCDELFELECEFKFIRVNRACNEIRELMLGWTRQFLIEFNILPDRLKEACVDANAGKTVTIVLNFNELKNHEKIMERLAYYKGENIYLLNED